MTIDGSTAEVYSPASQTALQYQEGLMQSTSI
jgi:hypothetical protein